MQGWFPPELSRGSLTTILAWCQLYYPPKDNHVHADVAFPLALCLALKQSGQVPPDPHPSPVLTGKDFILQITMFFSGMYLALPTLVLKRGESASLGTGTDISTLLATDCFLNCPLACCGGESMRHEEFAHRFCNYSPNPFHVRSYQEPLHP